MPSRKVAAAATLLLSVAAAVPAAAFLNAPPAIPVYPDDYPVEVAFFFPAGGPLERFTARPGAWYAIYRMPMYPGVPYDLLLTHAGDPARMKVFALDNHPFDKVAVRHELPFRKQEARDSRESLYAATISTPRDTFLYGVYLLLEWSPPTQEAHPIPVTLQALTSPRGPHGGRGRPWGRPAPESGVESPLQSQGRNPLEIPLPRRDGTEKRKPD